MRGGSLVTRPRTPSPLSREGAHILAVGLSKKPRYGAKDWRISSDKPYPLAWTSPAQAAYAKRYNDEYARTPITLRAVDS
jgi:hypothetical protein